MWQTKHLTSPSLLLTCEHASARMPPPWQWPPADLWLRPTHWAVDVGAAALSLQLARHLPARVVLARFSRLLADANRPEHSTALCRTEAEGRPIMLNQAVDGPERAHRLTLLHRAYHSAVAHHARAMPATLLLSLHTFTPVYCGQRRQWEMGVLYHHQRTRAQRLLHALRACSYDVGDNAPYAGTDGLTYAIDRHSWHNGLPVLELEVRQDLAQDPAFRRRFLPELAAILTREMQHIARQT
ncbi:MAG: N-formylglutamate amidohydrolase [Polyangiales bacterium]